MKITQTIVKVITFTNLYEVLCELIQNLKGQMEEGGTIVKGYILEGKPIQTKSMLKVRG